MRILVPKGRRLKVLEVAHTHILAGHFGRKKTFARLSSRFLWPRMWLEVKDFVRCCTGCQKAGRKDRARAPLQPLQCESEPFTKVAFDLVGPLPRSTNGFKYLLTMMDLFSKFPAAIPLKKVDLNKGFHQIPVEPSHYQKTVFCTPWGKYEFRVMPFGVRNGPSVFQRLMDRVLHRDGDLAVVYIDDIAIFSSSWDQHCLDIRTILDRLREAGLTANTKKCLWGQTHCEFLGHLVGGGMVSPAALKVEAVRQFSQPKTKTQVRQFLGLTGYYRKFVVDYAMHSYNLTEATKKSAPEKVVWTTALESEFCHLKNILCAVPSLTLPTADDEFLLQTDASGVGLGAVLSVVRNKEEFPVAFFSRKLQPREMKFAVSELEGLAVVSSILKFDAYLLPRPFILETDHRALLFLNSANQCNGRLARWALKLQPFTYSIRYRPGKDHVNADTLSRLCFEGDEISLPVSPTAEGGGDVMESPTQQHQDSKHGQAGASRPDSAR